MVLRPKDGKSKEARPHSKPRRALDLDDDMPTPNDNLMYLLYELERAVQQPTIKWSAELATAVQRRLDNLGHAVRQIALRQD